jgi:hypothetical protein
VPLLILLLAPGLVVFLVIGYFGLRSPVVKASCWWQLGVLLLATLAAIGTVVVLGLLAVRAMFEQF